MSRYAYGVDPGHTGGIACVEVAQNGTLTNGFVEAVPTSATKVGGKDRRQYELHALNDLLHKLFADQPPTLVLLEKQQVHYKDGRVSAGTTMFGYGMWRGMLVALGAPHVVVEAKDWRTRLGIPKALKRDAGKRAVRTACMNRLGFALVDKSDSFVALNLCDALGIAIVATERLP